VKKHGVTPRNCGGTGSARVGLPPDTFFKGPAMSKNQHNSSSMDKTMNQNNQMSDDPGDGSRVSFTLGKDGNTPAEKAPKNDAQDQSTIEAFGQEGAGIASKE
jgi:hypothetical protein